MRNIIRLILLPIMAIISCPGVMTAKDAYADPYKGYDESAFMDMDLEQNILTPAVGKAEHPAVRSYMRRMGQELAKKGYIVDMMRDDEVVLVTIPSDDLFLPNDTLLSPAAPGRLSPLIALLSDPEMFKMVYAIHTDNTGSASYNMELSHQRNNSIYDWMLGQVSDDLIVIPYEFGDTDPIEANTSRKGRAANRRLELYFIPGPKMITLAHKKNLR